MPEALSKLFGCSAAALCLAGAAVFTAGCDQEAQNRLAAAGDFDDALALINEANASSPDPDTSVSEARLRKLREAKPLLQSVFNQGSATQKAQAAMLLADIETQDADRLRRQAEFAFAQIKVDIANLLADIETVDTVAATATAAQVDPQTAIDKTDAAIQEFDARRGALTETLGRLDNEVSTLRGQIDAQKKSAQEAFTEKSRLESQAFVADGEEKYALLDRAGEAQQKADAADVAAQELEIRLDKIESGLVLARRDAAMSDAALEKLKDARQVFEEAGADAKQAVRVLRDEQTAQAETLAAAAVALAERFDAEVRQPLDAAGQNASAAVSGLQGALSGASGTGRDALENDLLAKQLVHAQTLATAAGYAASMSASLDAMAGRAAFDQTPELQSRLSQAAAPLADQAATFRQAAADSVASAKAMLADADPEDAGTATANQTVARIEGQVGSAGNAG